MTLLRLSDPEEDGDRRRHARQAQDHLPGDRRSSGLILPLLDPDLPDWMETPARSSSTSRCPGRWSPWCSRSCRARSSSWASGASGTSSEGLLRAESMVISGHVHNLWGDGLDLVADRRREFTFCSAASRAARIRFPRLGRCATSASASVEPLPLAREALTSPTRRPLMPAPRSHRRARLAALVCGRSGLTGLQLLLAPAAQAAGSTGLVIKEVYGAGGNAGAVLNADFVELYNPQATPPVPTNGLSVQYRSASGASAAPSGAAQRDSPGRRPLPDPDERRRRQRRRAATPDLVASPAHRHGRRWRPGHPGHRHTRSAPATSPAPPTSSTWWATSHGRPASRPLPPAWSLPTTQSAEPHRRGDRHRQQPRRLLAWRPSPTPPGPAAAARVTNPGTKTGTSSAPRSTVQPRRHRRHRRRTPGRHGRCPPGSASRRTGPISGTPDHRWAAYNVEVDGHRLRRTLARAPTPRPSPRPSTRGRSANTDQGHPGHRRDASPFAGQTVTTEGVVTAAYPTGGLNGFYIQTAGADTRTPRTRSSSTAAARLHDLPGHR